MLCSNTGLGAGVGGEEPLSEGVFQGALSSRVGLRGAGKLLALKGEVAMPLSPGQEAGVPA